jgi:hypothetical protein
MYVRLIIVALVFLETGQLSAQSYTSPYAFCAAINRVATGLSLSGHSDDQVKNGLCMTSALVADAISERDSLRELTCMNAARHMMREFSKRSPGSDPKSVIGRCDSTQSTADGTESTADGTDHELEEWMRELAVRERELAIWKEHAQFHDQVYSRLIGCGLSLIAENIKSKVNALYKTCLIREINIQLLENLTTKKVQCSPKQKYLIENIATRIDFGVDHVESTKSCESYSQVRPTYKELQPAIELRPAKLR